MTNRLTMLSIAAAIACVVLLAALHTLNPDLDPSWRFISEYANGPHGWMLGTAFVALAASHLALFAAAWPMLASRAGRAAGALLAISAAGLVIAAVFPTDPITATGSGITASGRLHNLGATLGIAMPFGIASTAVLLARQPHGIALRRPLVGAACLALASLVMAIAALAYLLTRSGGAYGPDVPVGWPNRAEMAGYCTALVVVGTSLGRMQAAREQTVGLEPSGQNSCVTNGGMA